MNGVQQYPNPSHRKTTILKIVIAVLVLFAIYGVAYGILKIRLYRPDVYWSLEDLVNDADIILVGKVVSKKSELRSDERDYNVTTQIVVSPENENYIKGNSLDSEIIIKKLGGEINGRGYWTPNVMVNFNKDEEILVFLYKRKGEPYYGVVGDILGKYSIQTDEKTGKRVVFNDSQGLLSEDKSVFIDLDRVIIQMKEIMGEAKR